MLIDAFVKAYPRRGGGDTVLQVQDVLQGRPRQIRLRL